MVVGWGGEYHGDQKTDVAVGAETVKTYMKGSESIARLPEDVRGGVDEAGVARRGMEALATRRSMRLIIIVPGAVKIRPHDGWIRRRPSRCL